MLERLHGLRYRVQLSFFMARTAMMTMEKVVVRRSVYLHRHDEGVHPTWALRQGEAETRWILQIENLFHSFICLGFFSTTRGFSDQFGSTKIEDLSLSLPPLSSHRI